MIDQLVVISSSITRPPATRSTADKYSVSGLVENKVITLPQLKYKCINSLTMRNIILDATETIIFGPYVIVIKLFVYKDLIDRPFELKEIVKTFTTARIFRYLLPGRH